MTASPRASLALSIDHDNAPAQRGLSLLDRLAPRPSGAPAQHLVAQGLQRCLLAAISVIGPTDSRPEQNSKTICALVTELETKMEKAGQVESLQAVQGLKSKYPGWFALYMAGAAEHTAAKVFLGLKILVAQHDDQHLGSTACSRFHTILNSEDLSDEQVEALLTGPSVAEDGGSAWVADLHRTYRQVLRAYMPQTPPPPSTGRSRVTGQLLDGVLAATAARRAGATNHRELSPGQMAQLLTHIEQNLKDDTLTGCMGVLVGITGFTPDLLIGTPLTKPASTSAADLYLDPHAGVLHIDHSGFVHDASTAQPGCVPASLVCKKPLPTQLHHNLLQRCAKHPDATELAELYPETQCPANDEPVYPTRDMICPSWARYRNSVGRYLRDQGFDNLMSAVMSGRFWHIPKSKLYYMTLPREELQAGFNRFYKIAGWGDAATLVMGPAFGSRVVPTIDMVRAQDSVLVEACINHQPGKHAGIERLIQHHNYFMQLVGFRLSSLLALRESTGLDVSAGIHEHVTRSVPVHDKDVLHPLPMPLAHFTRETFGAVRIHCRALRGRLIVLDEGKSALARWCLAVTHYETVPLMQLARNPSELLALPTRIFLRHHGDLPRLPPDFGRKLMENELRRQGLRSSEVDAFLRHDVEGQSMLSSTSHHQGMATWTRTTRAVDKVATLCFCAVAYGLAKE